MEHESPALLDYFGRRVSPVEDAADLVAETLLVVWRKATTLPADEVEARMWLFGVARRTLSTYRRGHHRQTALADRLRSEIAAKAPAAGLDGQPASSRDANLAEHVRACVRELGPIEREIIMLVHWEGFSFEEVARILAMRPATVRSRHLRARAALRETLLMTEDLA